MIAVICAFVLIAALAGHAGYLHSQVRRLRRLDRPAPKLLYSDLFAKRLDKVEEMVNAVFKPQFVYTPAKPAYRLMTLAERRQQEEPCTGICPKCGGKRVGGPAGAGFGECLGCAEEKLVDDLLYGGWIVGHSDVCMCCDCFRARTEFKVFTGYNT